MHNQLKYSYIMNEQDLFRDNSGDPLVEIAGKAVPTVAEAGMKSGYFISGAIDMLVDFLFPEDK